MRQHTSESPFLKRRRKQFYPLKKKEVNSRGWLHRFADWLNDLHVVRIFQAASSFLLILTLIGFWLDYQGRQQSRIVSAWQLITKKSPGNSGKIEALEYLNSIDQVLMGIDLSSDNEDDSSGTYLSEINLSKAILSKSKLMGANLYKANFHRASLLRADLRKAFLYDADLSLADLSRADLSRAILTSSNLSGTVINDADLNQANLIDVTNLTCSQLTKAKNWQFAYREKKLACGADIPIEPKG
ncbi:pentapeptide repeat-containing protein [Marinomonas sp. TW1]|uniref:pentapeptide repeat-containing protein n=1 Tax=Marinomonas sp. TW1 TaxID=1561203 RepID=UPI0007AFC5E6|nr:pentapeptide repeat-containing protein [Marinomonas sp. TW1]